MPAGGRGRKPNKPNAGAAKTTTPRRVFWALEASLVTMGCDDPTAPRTFPFLVIAMAVLHRPGTQIADAAIDALRSIRERGYPAGWLAADNAYTNLVEDSFQRPVRALGYSPVLDYKINQLGIKKSHAGAIQVEGNWYCPGMPKKLVDATLDYVEGRIDEAVWKQRIASRTAYLLRPKSKPEPDGTVRLMCPAAGLAPTARCDLKPRSEDRTKGGVTRVFPDAKLRNDNLTICGQDTVTFPAGVGGKYEQDLQYATEAWSGVYNSLRNTIEGKNGISKDDAFEAIGTPTRHRIRGIAAQTVFAAFGIYGMNMRTIDTFEANAKRNGAGVLQLPSRRRRVPASVTIEAPFTTLVAQSQLQLLARAEYSTGGKSNITRHVEWKSSDETVATVSDMGLVRAVSPGTARITAWSHPGPGPGHGSRSGHVDLTVTPNPNVATVVENMP